MLNNPAPLLDELVLVLLVLLTSATPPGSAIVPLAEPSASLGPPSVMVNLTQESPACRPFTYWDELAAGHEEELPGADAMLSPVLESKFTHDVPLYLRYATVPFGMGVDRGSRTTLA